MLNLIDRRPSSRGKSAVNRERFLRRYKSHIQDAVKKICQDATLVLVVGSKTSSNANRLVEVARTCGADAYLVDDERDVDPAWLGGHETLGLTAGASSPDLLVNRVADRLAELGYAEREEVELTREDVYFRLPAGLRS